MSSTVNDLLSFVGASRMDIESTVNLGFQYLILFTLPGILVGTVIALPVLIPPVRRLARTRAGTKSIMMVIGGLISFIAAHGSIALVLTYVSHSLMMPWCVVEGSCPPGGEETIRKADGAAQELLLRQMLPLPIPDLCYTTSEQCAHADWYVMLGPGGQPGQPAWPEAIPYTFGEGLGAAAVCAFLVWRFTRPPKPEPAGAESPPPVEGSIPMA